MVRSAAAASFGPFEMEQALAALLDAAPVGAGGALKSGPRARRRAMRDRFAKTGAVAALLGLEGCLPIIADPEMFPRRPAPGGPGPGGGGTAPAPVPEPMPAPAPPPIDSTQDAPFAVAENAATNIPTSELLEFQPGAVSILAIVAAEHGVAVLSGSIVQFTPVAGYEGAASITFTFKTASGETRTGTFSITVDDDAAQASGDHDHGAGGSTGGGGGHTHDSSTPHADDPKKLAEHQALLNLVPVADATHVAVKDGSWFDPATWANGAVPGDGARVVIPSGVTVAYDGESPASIFTIRVDGALEFATDRDTRLEVDTFVVTPSGRLTIGTADNPVAADVEAVIVIADNGPIDVAWDPTLVSRGLISHGAVEIHGAEKENFIRVAVDPLRGATSLTLEAPPEGWRVGDKIVLTGTHLTQTGDYAPGAPRSGDTTEDEVLTITAITGNVVQFDRPLQFDHEGARSDLKAYVANYTRNVRIESENGAATPTSERGHAMFMHSDNVDIRYAEFSELGRTDKSTRAFDLDDLASVASDSNLKGRYSLHIHRAGVGDLDDPVMIVGNSVWGSPGWGFVHHDSNAIFAGNAAYDVFGGAFVAESGNETGRWVDNISIRTIGVNSIPKSPDDVGAFDLARNGVGFWFQGRLVDAVDNVAAGSPGGYGFVYMHREPAGEMTLLDDATVPQGEKLRFSAQNTIDHPNIGIFDGNESIATRVGLEIAKANPAQGHDVRSILSDFTAWETYDAVVLHYTGHYTLKNFYLVATDQPLTNADFTAGFWYGVNAFDIVNVGARIEGFADGIRTEHRSTGPGVTDFGYTFIDASFAGNTRNYRDMDQDHGTAAEDRFLTSAELPNLALGYQPVSNIVDGPDTALNLPSVELAGTKTDTLGATETSPVWDPFNINIFNIIGAVETNGIWRLADGRIVTLFEEYVADRVTGAVEKFAIWVDVPAALSLPTFTNVAGKSVTAVDHGLLDLNNNAPITVDDAAHVASGEAVVIDVLANDRDPEGDALILDAIFSEHGHVVINDDDTLTYFADPGYVGVDAFYYWAQDDQGNFTKTQVTVTVEI